MATVIARCICTFAAASHCYGRPLPSQTSASLRPGCFPDSSAAGSHMSMCLSTTEASWMSFDDDSCAGTQTGNHVFPAGQDQNPDTCVPTNGFTDCSGPEAVCSAMASTSPVVTVRHFHGDSCDAGQAMFTATVVRDDGCVSHGTHSERMVCQGSAVLRMEWKDGDCGGTDGAPPSHQEQIPTNTCLPNNDEGGRVVMTCDCSAFTDTHVVNPVTDNFDEDTVLVATFFAANDQACATPLHTYGMTHRLVHMDHGSDTINRRGCVNGVPTVVMYSRDAAGVEVAFAAYPVGSPDTCTFDEEDQAHLTMECKHVDAVADYCTGGMALVFNRDDTLGTAFAAAFRTVTSASPPICINEDDGTSWSRIDQNHGQGDIIIRDYEAPGCNDADGYKDEIIQAGVFNCDIDDSGAHCFSAVPATACPLAPNGEWGPVPPNPCNGIVRGVLVAGGQFFTAYPEHAMDVQAGPKMHYQGQPYYAMNPAATAHMQPSSRDKCA